MKKLAAVSMSALMIALIMALTVMPASAQQYPPERPTCPVSDTTVSPGDQVTVTGANWEAGSTVTITLQPEGINLGSATVGANSSFSVTVTIPDSVQPGPHRIVCSGINLEGISVSRSTAIQVLGGVVGGGGGAAFTGSTLNVPLWMVLIAGLFGVGVALVLVGRRRRRRGAHTGS